MKRMTAMMGYRVSSGLVLSVSIFLSILLPGPTSLVQAWGPDGHHVICNVAEKLLNPIALAAVEELLPDTVDGHLSNLCVWADDVRNTEAYRWSAPLHYIDTPDNSCTYNPRRDCQDAAGRPNFCASGAISNYTDQLRLGTEEFNLTESLLFLSHIVGDIHQPLHVGHGGDHGGNSIDVYWYKTRTNLHNVWDTSILVGDEQKFFDGNVAAFTAAIYDNITSVWEKEAAHWNVCAGDETACPHVYASESIKIACEWAYPTAACGTTLNDRYFLSRLPVLQKRLGQAAVRLAGILNRLFPDEGSR